MLDSLIKRTGEVQEALDEIVQELSRLQTVLKHAEMSGERQREPLRRPATGREELPARPASSRQPYERSLSDRPARPVRAEQPARSPYESNKDSVGEEQDLASLLERSAWDEVDQAMSGGDEIAAGFGTESPVPFVDQGALNQGRPAGWRPPTGRPAERRPSSERQPERLPSARLAPPSSRRQPPPTGPTRPVEEQRSVPLPSRPATVEERRRGAQAEPRPDQQQRSRLPPDSATRQKRDGQRASQRQITRPPGAWSPAPERERRPRSEIKMRPQQDLAAMLEGGDWSDDPATEDKWGPKREPRNRHRRERKPPQAETSNGGIQDLLSGYLKDDVEE